MRLSSVFLSADSLLFSVMPENPSAIENFAGVGEARAALPVANLRDVLTTARCRHRKPMPAGSRLKRNA